MRSKRARRTPKSLSFSQVVKRVLIAVVVIFILVFIALLVNHRYLHTQSKVPEKAVASSYLTQQPQPKKEPSPASSEPSAEVKPDTSLTFYENLVNKQTTDLTPPSVPSEPKAVTPMETAPAQAEKGGEEVTLAGYTVQVGSFQSLDIAEGIVESFKKKGYSPSLATVSFPNGRTWHRVRLGNCNSREEAEVLVQKIKEGGNFEPMIISPEKGNKDSHKSLTNNLDSAAVQSPPLPH